MRSGSNQQSGFSLLELMVVLGIAGIMAGLAVPFMGETLAKSRINGDYRSIRDALNLAKSGGQTGKTFSSVIVCPGSESDGCTGAAWEKGFIVFGDVDGNGNYTSAGDSSVIAVQDALSAQTTMTVTDENNGGAAVTKIALTEKGYTADFGDDSAPSYLFKYCNSGSTNATIVKGLVYGPGGVIRMTVDSDGDGIPNYGAANLSCP